MSFRHPMKPRFAPLLLVLALALSPSCAQPAPSPASARQAPPLLAAAPAPAASSAPWKITATAASESISPGLTSLRHSLENPAADPPSRPTLHLIRFDSSENTFKVVDQGDTKPGCYTDLAEAMKQNSCLAGTNGGYFHPDFRPVGLVITDGSRINKFEEAKLLSGLLLVDSTGPRLLRRAEFKDHSGITQLLQAGPYLVDGGRTVAGLSSTPARTRTFVATDGGSGWALGICTRVSLADLGAILANPALTGGFKISRALNLDGGSSSALYFERPATGGAPHHSRSFVDVRNFLGIAGADQVGRTGR